MAGYEDPRLLQAKAMPIVEVIDRLGIAGLRATGGERVGPCPLCGGRDRFGINLRTNAFLCRRCGIKGGDQVALVQEVLSVDFRGALQWLCGDAPASIDPKELERRRRKAAEAERRQREASERYRRQAIADAQSIWSRSRPGAEGVVRAYLMARGITPDLYPNISPALRFIAAHPYVKKVGGALETLHRGPCMVAGILSPGGEIVAVHQTWVDAEPPHGKARITWGGETISAKLVRGSKKGNAIRLHVEPGSRTLVMAEGIETTLSALVADAVPGASYWAGVDLGNMGGKQERVDGTRNSGVPDMSDGEAFVPPPWVERLIFIQDGDSDPRATRAKLVSGLKRAMALRPGLKGQIVHAGHGVDLNDVLNGACKGLEPGADD
ncbi:DUF7146 domain-containing protein [Pseudooceanicola nitratireducens]|uniref:DUF7146 domain-containing protein n=1 Tax=Pseudooceanicola nitratireducens TaxID=517719 RepID=UPI0023F4B4EE|nr:primase-helicase zinc-binding domain-containing protein [Pseudooceanicola nitratireducens]